MDIVQCRNCFSSWKTGSKIVPNPQCGLFFGNQFSSLSRYTRLMHTRGERGDFDRPETCCCYDTLHMLKTSSSSNTCSPSCLSVSQTQKRPAHQLRFESNGCGLFHSWGQQREWDVVLAPWLWGRLDIQWVCSGHVCPWNQTKMRSFKATELYGCEITLKVIELFSVTVSCCLTDAFIKTLCQEFTNCFVSWTLYM